MKKEEGTVYRESYIERTNNPNNSSRDGPYSHGTPVAETKQATIQGPCHGPYISRESFINDLFN